MGHQSEDELLQPKQKKAKEYASEPERFIAVALSFMMKSKHGVRFIAYLDGVWHCTCDFFEQHGTCSHVMALGKILEPLTITQPAGNSVKSESIDDERQ
jgi:hypothetical protein